MALSLSKGRSSFVIQSLIMPAWFYILRLKSGSLYVGSTTDLEKRFEDHCSGRACRTTKFDSPIAIVLSEQFETFSEARLREAQVKRWSGAKKEALVSGSLATLRNLAKSK
jgi:putative endonuclease